MKPPGLTLEDAAKVLGCKPSTLRDSKWRRRVGLPTRRWHLRRRLYWLEDELRQWMAERHTLENLR